MAHSDELTAREFIKSFRKKELEGFSDHYRGRQKALPEISPKRMPRAAWTKLFKEYVAGISPKP